MGVSGRYSLPEISKQLRGGRYFGGLRFLGLKRGFRASGVGPGVQAVSGLARFGFGGIRVYLEAWRSFWVVTSGVIIP